MNQQEAALKARGSLLVALVAVLACGPAEAPEVRRPIPEPGPEVLREAATAFGTIRDGFLEWYYEANPVHASELGVTAHDGRLPGMDRLSVQRRIDALLDWDSQLGRIPIRLMREGDRFDYAVLEYGIRAELLDMEEVRLWAVDPVGYTDLIGRGLVTLVDRRAPGEARTEALRSRLEASREVLSAARSNLRSPPRIWTEQAVAQTAGLTEYVESLPELLAAEPGGQAAAAAVGTAVAELAAALREHRSWLETQLLPTSTGDFRTGRYLFNRKLLYREHIDLPISELDRLNEARIEEYRSRLEAVARELDPARTPRAILDSLAAVAPAPDELLNAAGRAMLEARDWVAASRVVSLPEAAVPQVRQVPSFSLARGLVLRPAGPFDAPGRPAHFELASRPGSGLRGEGQGDLRAFGEAWIRAAALAETYPGRHVQSLHEVAVESDVRRVFMPRTLTGGWAHYAEGMALHEGFRDGDLGIRLAHLQRALERHARWFAALHLHAHGRPVDQAVARVAELAYLDEARARVEVEAVARDPLAWSEALGGAQIVELRARFAEFVEGQDREMALHEFHDQLLALGLPIPLATEALMPPPERPTRTRR